MSPWWSLLVGLLWLGFLIAVGVGILAYRSYKNLRPLRESVADNLTRVATAINQRTLEINQLRDLLTQQSEWEGSPMGNARSDLIAAYRQSSSLLTAMREIADRSPDVTSTAEFHQVMGRIQRSEIDIWQRIESYHAALRVYNAARNAFPAFLYQLVDDNKPEPFDLSSISGLYRPYDLDDEEVLGWPSRTESANYFYVLPGGVPKGPVSQADLKSLVARGVIPRDVMIAEANSQEWRPLSS